MTAACAYPVNLVVAGRSCLVVGGGRVAVDKVRGLVECEAVVEVVAPDVRAEIYELAATVSLRAYRSSDVEGRHLVITATDDPAVNRLVATDADRAGVWVNSADDPANCSFTLPARIRSGDLLVTFSTNGRSPALSSWLRRRFDDELGPEYGVLIDLLAEARESARASGRKTEAMSWQKALDSGMLDAIRDGRIDDAKETLQACLS